ncbi:hypothetical protein LguiA_014432 [Lonicera macranthoides]
MEPQAKRRRKSQYKLCIPSKTKEATTVERTSDDYNENLACSTPKAQRFRIPEIRPCPPAPKKKRVAPICSSKTSPIAFFASQEIEVFFLYTLGN